MKKVVYSVSKQNRSGSTKMTGLGFITESDLVIACTSKSGKAYIHVTVRISKAFFSWLTMYEGNIKIKAPENVRQEYITFLRNLIEKA